MKRLIAVILLLIMTVCLVPSALAAQPDLPGIVDEANLLTYREESALEDLAQEFRQNNKMDVVIVTVDSLGGKSAQNYADDYYDDHGYGVGSDYSGVLLLIDMGDRQWYISTCGDAIEAISDRDIDKLFDAMSDDLSHGDYYEAFTGFIQALEDHLQEQSAGPGMKGVLIAVVIGAAVGGIALLVMRSSMNTKRKQSGAGDYLKRDSFHLRVHRDMYLYSRVTKRPRPKDNGGSSVHHSSGGRSHGGGGGRF